MIKIYTMTHRTFQQPQDAIYIPLHVGRSNAEDLGYLGDDTGDNISEWNPYYGELTGIYWVWKNETEADIIGICHYRRYFLTDAGRLMTQKDYVDRLSDCDVLVSTLISGDGNSSNRENYANAHNIADLDAVEEALRYLYPRDYPAFCQVMRDSKCCFANLMVTSREKFHEYCSWLFPIIELASKKIDVSSYDMYHQRVYGFLSEVLLYVWIIARGYRLGECRVGLTSEKAETAEFKRAIGQLILQGDIDEAKKLFYDYLKLRPDVRERMSDINGEVPVIEILLYIMHEERHKGEEGLLTFSRDLQVLIMHYRNIRKLLEQYDGHVREAGADYFTEFPVSDTALAIIKRDICGELSFYEYLNEGSRQKPVTVIMVISETNGNLAESIGNLVHQTLSDMELMFVDNHSRAESRAILLNCQKQYPYQTHIITPTEKLEEEAALQWGLQIASGEFVGVVRAGDIPDVTMYEKLYNRTVQGGYDVVESGYIDIRGDMADEKNCLLNKLIRRELLLENSQAAKRKTEKLNEILYCHR